MNSVPQHNDYACDADLEAMVEQFFAEKSDADVVAKAEADGLPTGLWDAALELGLPLVGLPESAGGSGGSILDVVTVLRAAARHAAPLPLVETYLAGRLAVASGLPVPAGITTVAPGSHWDTATFDGTVSGTLYDVPWGSAAAVVAAILGDRVVLLNVSDAKIGAGTDFAGQPRQSLTFTGAPAVIGDTPVDTRLLSRLGAFLRSVQMAGAMEAVSTLTQRYVSQRVQFGSPVAQFQAVQQHIVTLAQMASMSTLAVDRTACALTAREAEFEVIATKLVVSQNALLSVRAAHQAHGAIGMTQEYRLQQLTRRLHAWRCEFGDEIALATQLGRGVAAAPSLARLITNPKPILELTS
ncbi:acyl-CoA dehydrogenase family protein [Rhodococcus sp. IEGM 1379]|uniref:acyl-CoA dehydrogenase family protein n=1 Tax=Rhodococcus sp. IEGM 1379 TaxID=3047086 RepID=UPI0024B77F74|nr:acyl-CoA dehydrogenase family protein [Rhodococcus sp. IEGM 1379]MDI9917171.1 acyl-CoA dehydrogenase family protein [Rhodococcus sp. IEGM 1379]